MKVSYKWEKIRDKNKTDNNIFLYILFYYYTILLSILLKFYIILSAGFHFLTFLRKKAPIETYLFLTFYEIEQKDTIINLKY